MTPSKLPSFSLEAAGLSLKPASFDPETDAQRILEALDGKLDPYTRADVNVILKALDYPGHGGQNPMRRTWIAVKAQSVKVSWGKFSPKTEEVAAPAKVQAKPPEKTLTFTWIVEQIAESHLNDRVAHLVRRKNPHMSWDDIRSFVDMWLMTFGERGTCDGYIAAGKAPTSSILAVWVNQKLRQSTYHDAQDALNREYHGLRTQKEIFARKETGASDYLMPGAELHDPSGPEVVWEVTGKEDGPATPVVVEKTFEEAFDPAQISLVEDLLKVRHRRTKVPYEKVFSEAVSGRSLEESALIRGCSKLRISNLRQNVRSTLRDLPVVLDMAYKVLGMLAEEPYSTLEELSQDLSPADDPAQSCSSVREVLDLLVVRGLAVEAKGKSFAPTDAGRQACTHRIL
jgi:hypothetical protein